MQYNCRTCEDKNNVIIPISSQQSFGKLDLSISDVIMKCTSVQIHNGEDLPQLICKKCCDELSTAFSFKNRCEEMDVKYRSTDLQFGDTVDGLNMDNTQIQTENRISYDAIDSVNCKQATIQGRTLKSTNSSLTLEAENPFLNGDLETFPSTVAKMEEETIKLNIVVPYRCEECHISYNGLASYETHCTMHHGSFSGNTRRTPKLSDVEEPNLIEPGTSNKNQNCKIDTFKPFKCTSRDFSFTLKKNLKHILNRTGKQPFECDFCDYSSTSKIATKQHIMTHTSEKPFKCDYCDFSCCKKWHLEQHLVIHTEGPFKCDVCDYISISKYKFKRHTMIHTADKPFKCDVCDYSCISKHKLKMHTMTHVGEKPFLCDLCGFSSTTKSNLKKHVMTHTAEKPFKCGVCNYSCIAKANMDTHVMKHSGEKPFKCNDCDFSCTSNTILKQHTVTHGVEKPFKCDVCSYSSVRKYTLMTHKRRH